MDNKDSAEKLNISVNTLKTHLQHIYKKLEVHSKSDLILRYYREIIQRDKQLLHNCIIFKILVITSKIRNGFQNYYILDFGDCI